MSETRKLAAILVADIVGYSRLTGADEDRILARLRTLRSDLIDPTIAVHRGRVVKRTGDGAIVEFRSVVDAVRCAIEVQDSMAERNAGLPEDRRIDFRVGIHLGDVVEEQDGDLMGDGVNVAARLEGVAKPGGIALSEDAYRQVRARLDLKVSDLGPTQLKNIAEPVRVYSLQVGVPSEAKQVAATSALATQTTPAPLKRKLPLVLAVLGVATLTVAGAGAWYFLGANSPAPNGPQQLSIVVLPLANLSGDASQDYFADVLTDQLTTYLSRIPGSFVIARNTAFTYKGKPTDVKQIGKDLGVRYALEGSVQPTANRIRVNAQLIDTETGAHLWAEEFDHDRADLLATEDDIVTRLARTLRIQLTDIEAAKLHRSRPAANPNLQELTLRCQDAFLNARGDTSPNVFSPCEEALKLDQNNPVALAALSLQASVRVNAVNSKDREADVTKAVELAARALAVEPNNPDVHYAEGNALQVQKRFDEAKAEFERAIAINPSEMGAYAGLALANFNTGDTQEVIAVAEQANRLSPRDPQKGSWLIPAGLANITLHRDDQAVDLLRRGVVVATGSTARAWLAAALALAGHEDEARATLKEYLAAPDARPKTIAAFKKNINSNNPTYLATRERIYEGLRKAGMPEDDAPHLSIVVLPFANLSGDPEQDYFADGITDDLTTDLSHIADSFVIARNTAFTYKGKSVDVKEIGRDLGVRYALEGSVRRVGEAITINAQLVSTETGAHVWADRFEGEQAKLGQLQVDVVARIANALGAELIRAENLRALREHPDNHDAVELAMRAKLALVRMDNKEAMNLYEQALTLDPNLAQAQIGLAFALANLSTYPGATERDAYLDRAERLADQALSTRPDYAFFLYGKAVVLAAKKQPEAAILEAEAAIKSDPNYAAAYGRLGGWKGLAGRAEEGLADVETAIRLSPHDPVMWLWELNICSLRIQLAQWDQAIAPCRQALAANPKLWGAHFGLLQAYGWLGREPEAKAELAEGLKLLPPGTTVSVKGAISYARTVSDNPVYLQQMARAAEGLRKAGLPEE
jgi:adenylate cyclase